MNWIDNGNLTHTLHVDPEFSKLTVVVDALELPYTARVQTSYGRIQSFHTVELKGLTLESAQREAYGVLVEVYRKALTYLLESAK